jgi:hypothetical protein
MSEIQSATALFVSREQSSWAYPPQQIPTDSTTCALTVADVGIKCRELFTVSERSQSTTPAPTHAKSRIDEAVEADIAIEADIASDNSCLFNVIG